MIERIESGGALLALILRRHRIQDGISFYTGGEAALQLGSMRRPKGYQIAPHLHKPAERTIQYTQEVVYVQSGRVRVDFFDDTKIYLRSMMLEPGDFVLLARGGHGFEFIEEGELIEIKQGPYVGEQDKERFESKVRERAADLPIKE
jgi:mannose-6-phosphate isomerase-like protein (cupin superfamily)